MRNFWLVRTVCLVVVLAVTVLGVQAQNKVVLDKVVAVIGDKIVLYSELDEYKRYMESQGETVEDDALCFILEQLLSQKLLVVVAERDSILVSDDEVEQNLDSRVEQILEMMGNDDAQFIEYYGKTPVAMKEEMRDGLRDQMNAKKVQDEILANVKVTPSEVADFFRKIPKDSLPYFNAEVEFSILMIKPKVSAAQEKIARERAEEVRKMIMSGAVFEEVAKQYSDDPGSVQQGGNLGDVKRGVFVPEFEAAAFRLGIGEISQVVKTQFGYHVIRLNERRGNTINCSHVLIRPAILSEDNRLAQARVDSLQHFILTDSLNFADAVRLFSEDETSKNNGGSKTNPQTGETFFEVTELPPYVYFAIDTLEVGEISKAVEIVNPTGESDYILIRLDSRSSPHTANLKEDYAKIQMAALEAKKASYTERWLKERLPDTYFFFAEDFRDCPFVPRWQAQSNN